MAYRGDDLDLRTPQAWSSSGRDAGTEPNWWTRTTIFKGGRNDPIWVDDHVMACCNHAYDLARAHRSPEVRLEHLINALTLDDHAAQVLEARGLSVASLRRESGAAIANDIPSAAGGEAAPRRSEGFEEALRLAADYAYPRRTPVTVDDLLHIMFDMKRELPGVQLLRRHAASWKGRNGTMEPRPGEGSFKPGADPRVDLRLDPLPHLSRPRYASPGAHDYFSSQPATREASTTREAPPPREAPLSRSVSREPPVQSAVDTYQDSRLDTLERMVRDLGVDLADDRKTIRTLVSDLQRSTASQADDTGRFRGGLTERLAALEDALVRSRNDAAALPNAILDRMAMLERAIDARLAEASRPAALPSALLDRIASLERSIEMRLADAARTQSAPQALLERLAGLERTVDARLAEANRAPAVLMDRLMAVERSIEARLSDVGGRPTGPSPALLDRLSAIERSIEARLVEMGDITAAMNSRLQGLEDAATRPVEATLTPLVNQRLETITQFSGKVETLERTFQLLLDRMTGVERRLASGIETKATVDLSGVETRLDGLQKAVDAGTEQSLDLAPLTAVLTAIETRVSGLERTLDNRTAETGRTVSFIGERLRSFEEAIGGTRTTTIDRLGQIERALTAYAESTVASSTAHVNDLGEVHEALLKLNANQQTLAGSLEQWRLDNTGDLSVISNRIKVIEDMEERRAPQLEAVVQQVALVHNALAKREVRKNRFMHWLYGTDEWYSASWDTKRWRMRQAETLLPARAAEAVPLQPRVVPPIGPTTVAHQAPVSHTPPAPPPSALRR
jgi:hypothetical protein